MHCRFAIRSIYLIIFMLLAVSSKIVAAEDTQPNYSVNYSMITLSDFTDDANMNDKIYAIQSKEKKLNLQMIQAIIKNGALSKFQVKGKTVTLGPISEEVWIVLPITSISSNEMWQLTLGNQFQGRFSLFKEVSLYNLASRQYIFNSESNTKAFQAIPDKISLTLKQRETNFLILYVKTYSDTIMSISPQISSVNIDATLGTILKWLAITFSIASAFYLFALYIATRNLSCIFLSAIISFIAIRQFFVGNFIYINFLNGEIFIHLTWILTSVFLFATLLTSPKLKFQPPSSIALGLISIFLISGFTGLILMNPLPTTSKLLIQIPILFSCTLVTIIAWLNLFRREKSALTLALLSTTLGAIHTIYFAFENDLIVQSPQSLSIPQILTVLAPLFAFTKTVQNSTVVNEKNVSIENIFNQNLLQDNFDQDSLIEVKERSEHKRLLQVLEQERKMMSELQIKTARQTEDMRKAIETADEANRAKSAFLAIVSHEIRTPMTGIMGMVRLLQDTTLSKEQFEYTTTIKDSGDAMLALLNDILDFEKIESGKMELEIINFDLIRLLRGIVTLMTGHAEAKKIKIVLEIDQNTPTWVKGDPTRLRQVLLNLVNNAIKFTNKGNIYIRVKELIGDTSSLSYGEKQIYFAVQDSGIGISPDAQKKLFMPFAQADTSISRKYGGTGLGLAICKRLIEAMGGAINISSREGEGSTFFFSITMALGHFATEREEQSGQFFESADLRKKYNLNVLVVDDNGINQKVISGFLEKLGATSLLSGSGIETIELINTNNFDLVLLDLQLPDMNGRDVAKYIRERGPAKNSKVPIVAVTGNTDDDTIKSCFESGMNDFISKPVTFERIEEILAHTENKNFQVHPLHLELRSQEKPDIEESQQKRRDDGYYDTQKVKFFDLSALNEKSISADDHSVSDHHEQDEFAEAVSRFDAAKSSITESADTEHPAPTSYEEAPLPEEPEPEPYSVPEPAPPETLPTEPIAPEPEPELESEFNEPPVSQFVPTSYEEAPLPEEPEPEPYSVPEPAPPETLPTEPIAPEPEPELESEFNEPPVSQFVPTSYEEAPLPEEPEPEPYSVPEPAPPETLTTESIAPGPEPEHATLPTTHFMAEDVNGLANDSFEEAISKFENIETESSTKWEEDEALETANYPKEPTLLDFGLDENIIRSLKAGLSPEQLEELLIGFYEKADELIAAIGTSYIDHHYALLQARAHELKGMAGNFGFAGVSYMCAEIEKAAKNDEIEKAMPFIEYLGEHYAMARNYLREWFEKS